MAETIIEVSLDKMTSTEPIPVDCFICLSGTSRSYKVTGSKCTKENLLNTFEMILGSDIVQKLFVACVGNKETTICRSCLNIAGKVRQFATDLIHGAKILMDNDTSTQQKRMLEIPFASENADLIDQYREDRTYPFELKKMKFSGVTGDSPSPNLQTPNSIPRPVILYKTEQRSANEVVSADGRIKMTIESIARNSPHTSDHSYGKRAVSPDIFDRNVVIKTEEGCENEDQSIKKRSIATSTDCGRDHSYGKSKVQDIDLKKFGRVNIPSQTKLPVDTAEFESLIRALVLSDFELFSKKLLDHKELASAIKTELLFRLNLELSFLTTKNDFYSSLLFKYRHIKPLHDNAGSMIMDIVSEIQEKLPFLMDIFAVVAGNVTKQLNPDTLAPIASAYAILMRLRNPHATAWHRLTTIIGIRGHIDDVTVSRFNNLGLSLSTSSRGHILDDAVAQTNKNIVDVLKKNPLVKITAGKIDMDIQLGNQTEKNSKFLHMFASNIIFSRVASVGLSNTAPAFDLTHLAAEQFLPHGTYKETLMTSYAVLVGRILSLLPAFKWMKSLLPEHIHHPYEKEMSQRSDVFSLKLQFRNDKKHESFVNIMDNFENTLHNIFQEAFGSTEALHEFRVILASDQQTKMSLQEAKDLRSLATREREQLADLNPIMVDLWHTKQDLLEKAYKHLYNKDSVSQAGTLHYFRKKLQRTDVSGKVKGRYKQHHDLLTVLCKHLIVEQALEYFGMDGHDGVPKKNIPDNLSGKNIDEKRTAMKDILNKFLQHYHYGEFTLKGSGQSTPGKVMYRLLGTTSDGSLFVTPKALLSDKTNSVVEESSDRLLNYSSCLCHWGLHIMAIDDATQEGDFIRTISNLMYSLPFFCSVSQQCKYFVETINYILQVEHLLSPLMRLRVLEGLFVNVRGGAANNVESDLIQRHSSQNQKTEIRRLGPNLNEKAILRATGGADALASLVESLDRSLNVRKIRERRMLDLSLKEESIIKDTLRELRPFNHTQNRSCTGYEAIGRSPFDNINKKDMKQRIESTLQSLASGSIYIGDEMEESCNETSDEDMS